MKIILAILVAFILSHAPWRLAVLGVETFAMTPSHTRVDTGNEKYWDVLRLQYRLGALGWTIEYAPNLQFNEQQAYGLTSFDGHIIVVDSDLSWNGRYSVLLHEGGHILAPYWANRGQAEAFAETVAALAAHDGLREHARYLSLYKEDFVIAVLLNWRDVYRAAALLSE